MYKVVIIDDEIWGIRSINSTFNWSENGFEVIGEYTDAEEAIEEIYRLMPDVVCTDIKMAGLSGLELIKRINGKLNVKFVVISAYKNFEYAKEAIEYGVVAYGVKPVSTKEANDILKRLREILDREHGNINIDEKFKKYDIKNRDIKNEKFLELLNYIFNNYNRKLSLEMLAERFGLNDSYCSKLFNCYFECGFAQFVNVIRIKNAVELLENTSMSISDVCFECGFNDYSYFNKVFKQQIGRSPKNYRNSRKKD